MLKRVLLLCTISLLLLQTTHAQNKATDSLWQLVTTTKNDSIKFRLLDAIGDITYGSSEEILANAKREVAFGEKYKDKPCEVYGYFLYARVYTRIGDYVKAQDAIVKATMIAETIPNNSKYLAKIYNVKGTAETNNDKALEYLKKGIAICKDDSYKRILFYNIANRFLNVNQVDSTLYYAQKSNEIAIKFGNVVKNSWFLG